VFAPELRYSSALRRICTHSDAVSRETDPSGRVDGLVHQAVEWRRAGNGVTAP
jgi:hypothetical protein